MNSPVGLPKDLPHGIEGLEAYPFEWWPWLLFLLLIAVIALVYWFYRKRLQKKKTKTVIRDFALEIYREIQDLNVQEPFQKKQQEQFYYDLSFRLRQYLELKLNLAVTDMTVKELQAPLLKEGKLSIEIKEGIIAFLKKAEFIKFAQKLATVSEASEAKEQVLIWCQTIEKALMVVEDKEP